MHKRAGFTLIELLVVIAIIAILSVVVILTLNPAQLLLQSHDSNRVSDMATLNDALGIYITDQSNGSLGTASTTYVSIADPSATSTAGDQCQGLGLPALPTGDVYHCAASSTVKNVNGTGWIPINFNSISFKSPIGVLPTDPVNATSSGFFYTYTTNGTQYEVTAIPESQRYRAQFGTSPASITNYPGVMAQGNNFTLSELWSAAGLIGYWPMDEGSGGTVADASGNGNTGTWSGTPAGTSGYYSSGKVGSWAGTFSSGGTTEVSLTSPASLTGAAAKTISAWFDPSLIRTGNEQDIAEFGTDTTNGTFGFGINSNVIFAHMGGSGDFPSTILPTAGTWYFVAVTYNGSVVSLYINGQFATSSTETLTTGNGNFYFGEHLTNTGNYFAGSIDDVRVYNRALSAGEIAAIYNAQK